MNLKTWVPLALAIILGLVAMKIARDVIASKNAAPPSVARDLTEVVVVKRNLIAGSPLRAEDLSISRISTDVQPELVFRTVAELEGRVVREDITRGQPIVEPMLAPRGTGSGLQALVPNGMRAISLEINEFSGVAGFLLPGCRVDVVATIPGEAGEMLSRTVVQNVEVTAIGRRQQTPDDRDGPAKSVTLLVTPQQAEAIELSAATARPRLVLRGSGDNADAGTTGITVAELKGRPGRTRQDPWAVPVKIVNPVPATQPVNVTPVVQVSTPRQRNIRVIRGGIESEVVIEMPRTDAPSKWMTDANE